MRQIKLLMLCFLLTLGLSSFTKPDAMLKEQGVSLLPPAGDYVTTFSIVIGPYAGTYKAYADHSNPDSLIYLINVNSPGFIYVHGFKNPSPSNSFTFYFDDDANQELYGFVY